MKLLKHMHNRDTAFQIVERIGKHAAYVYFYNINYARLSGNKPACCGHGIITLRPAKEYEIINV